MAEAKTEKKDDAKAIPSKQDLDAIWQGDDFLKLTGDQVCAVLDQCRARSENTVYCAAARWWKHSKPDAALLPTLLRCIRFPMLTTSFLLDVVDEAFAPPALMRQAFEFHTSSPERRRRCPIVLPRDGPGMEIPISFTWRIEGVSKMAEGAYIFSPSFYVDGYWFRLQAGCIPWDRSDGPAFALFLSLVSFLCFSIVLMNRVLQDLPATGLDLDSDFFVQTESQFLVSPIPVRRYLTCLLLKQIRDTETKEIFGTHQPAMDTFIPQIRELGYFDLCHMSWAEFLLPTSHIVDADGSLQVAVRVKLCAT